MDRYSFLSVVFWLLLILFIAFRYRIWISIEHFAWLGFVCVENRENERHNEFYADSLQYVYNFVALILTRLLFSLWLFVYLCVFAC